MFTKEDIGMVFDQFMSASSIRRKHLGSNQIFMANDIVLFA